MASLQPIHQCDAPMCGSGATQRVLLDSGEVFGQFCERHARQGLALAYQSDPPAGDDDRP